MDGCAPKGTSVNWKNPETCTRHRMAVSGMPIETCICALTAPAEKNCTLVTIGRAVPGTWYEKECVARYWRTSASTKCAPLVATSSARGLIAGMPRTLPGDATFACPDWEVKDT